jgi:aminomuconate-semialdehyde/2-hydroxymuconate-6-semialdehyde dehydrogenase
MKLDIPYHLENFIGGNLIAPISGNFIDNVNPATGQVYGQIPDSHKKDVDAAVSAAKKIFPAWSTTSVEERFKVLNRIAELIDTNLEELALAETNDNGKPLWLSKQVDIPRASANFRFFATGIMHFATESHNMEDKAVNYTLRQPIGIVGCISPWNLPLYLFTWKIAPALAAELCNCKAIRSNTCYCLFIIKDLQGSRVACRSIEYRSWNRPGCRRGDSITSGSKSYIIHRKYKSR